MNILITGAFGFVGTNISQSLKNTPNYKLFAVDINKPALHSFDEYYKWDELEKIDWKEIDVIIHLAGKAHDTKNESAREIYFKVNYELTQIIFNYFIKSSARKFIQFSSVKAAAEKVSEEKLKEDVIPSPRGPYGESKQLAEKYIIEKSPKESKDKLYYILRPSMIHGPGNKGNLNLLYNVVSKGIPWPLGAFENKRSFTSIGNLQFLINKLIEIDIESGIYNVSDDDPISTNQLIKLIAESKNRNAKIWKINPILIKTIAKIGDYLRFPLNTESLRKLTESYVVSNEKIKNSLGISKMPLSSEEGMKITLSSFKN